MELKEKISKCLQRTLMLAVAALSVMLCSCDSVIYDEEDDCGYYVHFKYDYNMKWADAFAHEVHSVTLYVIDKQGNIVWHKTESGDALALEGYCMVVDVKPGEYDFIAWCGVENPVSFDIPDTIEKTGLTATLKREHGQNGSAHIRTDIDRLYYGHIENVTLADDRADITVPLIKDTNSLRVTLQHLSGELIDKDLFTYTVTDDNGSLDWDNAVLTDETINYHAWLVSSGTASTEPLQAPERTEGTRVQSVYSTTVAEFTLCRLMADHAPDTRLIIRRADNGETIVNINLIDALLLVKGYYNRDMSDQEYLDRQDEYSLTFFLDEGFRWINSYIYINSWRVVLQNQDL